MLGRILISGAASSSRCMLKRRMPMGLMQHHHLSTESESKKPSNSRSSNKWLSEIVDKTNKAIHQHPELTVAYGVGADLTIIGAAYGCILASGVIIPPDVAVAFALSRPFRRFRLPLDVAVAAMVAKWIPETTHIHISELINRTFLPDISKSILDKYGAAYMIGSRWTGVSVIAGLYVALSYGMDVSYILEKFGLDEIGTVLGSWAAAVVCSSAMYPVSLCGTGYVVPWMYKIGHPYFPNSK